MARIDRPVLKLVGNDGNAFAILGQCKRAAKAAEWTDEEWARVREDMTSGDYDHLLQVAMKHFEIY